MRRCAESLEVIIIVDEKILSEKLIRLWSQCSVDICFDAAIANQMVLESSAFRSPVQRHRDLMSPDRLPFFHRNLQAALVRITVV
jgi:hypothetical protein